MFCENPKNVRSDWPQKSYVFDVKKIAYVSVNVKNLRYCVSMALIKKINYKKYTAAKQISQNIILFDVIILIC